MKNVCNWAFCAIVALLCCVPVKGVAQDWSDEEKARAATAAGCSYLTQEEKEVYMYTNLARLYPAKYARLELPATNDDNVASLRSELLSRAPVQALYPDYEVYQYARCFAAEQSRTGEIGHERHTCDDMTGWTAENVSYGRTSGRDIVRTLLIDRNVSSLGHRKNCLNGIYNALGVSMNTHPNYGHLCVMDFMKMESAPQGCGAGQSGGSSSSVTSSSGGGVTQSYDPYSIRLSSEEVLLYRLVMAYRAEHGLPAIPLSPALIYVAQTHAKDVYEHFTEIPAGCNAHSWSAYGPWRRCDYYEDHRNSECVWSKPRELTTYRGDGFEIFHYFTPPTSGNCTAEGSLRGWKNSPGHNALILNLNNWSDNEWRAIGIAIYKGCACIWFGEESDDYTMNID